MGFLDRAVERLTGRRVAAPVVDTVWLARRLLGGRTRRFGLAAALALLRHVGRAVPPGARRRLGDGRDPDRPDRPRAGARGGDGGRSRRAVGPARPPPAREALARRRTPRRRPGRTSSATRAGRRSTSAGRATSAPGSARTSPASGSDRPSRPRSVRSRTSSGSACGSELEAALDELRLLRELRPPANARSTRPDRHVYLRRRGARWVCGTEPTPHGPIAGRTLARRAAQALDGFEGDDPRDVLPGLRLRLRRLAGDLRFEDAARLRDRIAALEQVRRADRRARAPAGDACVPGRAGARAGDGAGGLRRRRPSSRAGPCPRGGGGRLEVEAGLAEVDRAPARPSSRRPLRTSCS